MPKENPYLIKGNYKKTETVLELKDRYKIPSYEEFMKNYEPSEEIEVLTEAEYQDRVLRGPQFGPGNEQSTTAAVVVGATVTVIGGVVTIATGGVAAPAVAAVGARVAQGAYEAHQVYQVRNHLEARHLALSLGLGVGTLAALTNGSGDSRNSSSSTSFVLEKKTIWDWWGNGLTGEQRDYLLQIGYSDKGSTYSLYELKRTAKYREKELLTELSKTYIQQWINDNDYSSGEERDRRERVVNCSKKDSPVWRGKQHYRGDIKTNGKSGSERRYYRWDNTHNDIEVYNRHGKHLGSMDPRTGKMYRGPDPTNSIEYLLK